MKNLILVRGVEDNYFINIDHIMTAKTRRDEGLLSQMQFVLSDGTEFVGRVSKSDWKYIVDTRVLVPGPEKGEGMTDNELENMREQLRSFEVIYRYLRAFGRIRVLTLTAVGPAIVRAIDAIAELKGDDDEW